MRLASLVASPSAMGRTPLASGSSVPPWPTLVLGSPASRRMRLTALTAWVEPRPTGLLRMIQPWSISGAEAEYPEKSARDAIDQRRDDAAHHVSARRDRGQHQQQDDEHQQRVAADLAEALRERRRE